MPLATDRKIAAAGAPNRKRRFSPELTAQVGLIVATAGLVVIGAGSLLGLVFAPLALAVGLLLYRRSPTRHYVSFCFWLWMLAPLVRRLSDWQGSYQALSLVIITPSLVVLIAALGANRQSFWRFKPFIFVFCVCVYGAAVGIVQGYFLPATYTFLTWATPLIFACHIISHASKSDEIASALFPALVLGGLTMGMYGVYQFFFMPPWDAAWMVNAGMRSIGQPLPQEVRVFATMNAPGPFALFASAALLAMFYGQSKMRWVAAPPALAAFALSLVRSAWGGFVAGLFTLFLFGGGKVRVRYLAIAIVVGLASLPLLTYPPINAVFVDRFTSLTNLEDDTSFQVRIALSLQVFENVGALVFGSGLGVNGQASRLSTSDNSIAENALDNGVLDLFVTFGLAGLVLVFCLLLSALKVARSVRANPNAQLAAAIFYSTVLQLMFSNILLGASGMLVFPMVALAIAQGASTSPAVLTPKQSASNEPIRSAPGGEHPQFRTKGNISRGTL